jgi:hypothetical protein
MISGEDRVCPPGESERQGLDGTGIPPRLWPYDGVR